MNHDGPSRDLAFVRGVMEAAHLSTLAPGIYFMVWGVLMATGLGYSWLQAAYGLSVSPWIVWLALVAGGWGVSLFLGARERRRGRTNSAAGRVLAAVWVACGVSMTVALGGGLASGVIGSASVPGLLACFLAIGMVATGMLSGVRWLMGLGILWWGCAVALFLLSERTAVLLLALCALMLVAVPGFILELRAPSSGLRGPRD